jgi:hypothetical protein
MLNGTPLYVVTGQAAISRGLRRRHILDNGCKLTVSGFTEATESFPGTGHSSPDTRRLIVNMNGRAEGGPVPEKCTFGVGQTQAPVGARVTPDR